MVAEPSSKIKELKIYLEALFNFASQVPYSQRHLLPVIQAGKALIGIKPKNPPKNLLKWLEGYVKEFSLGKENNCEENKHEKPEVIEIAKLGELINSNNKTEAFEYLNYLKQVANQEYIAEYLMELAAQKSPFQLLFCYYVFKTIRNMERDCQSSFIELSISCLMDVNENVNASQFEVICYHSQILNTTMIRMNSIAPLLNDLVNTAKVEILEDWHSFIPQELIVLIREKGEMGVWTYLSGLPMEELNSELILRLDAVRSAARYPTNKTDWFMNKIINIPMKTEC